MCRCGLGVVCLGALSVVACGQLIGLDDFESAPGVGSAAGAAGSAGAAGDGGSGGTGAAGGSAGIGGTAGTSAGGTQAGGAGGTGGKPCKTNSECDDGKECTGTETCEGGFCRDGNSVDCSGIDSTYCAGKCFETSSGPKCQLTAKDTDGDMHGDSRCQEATGDDCDDGNDKVYTGAPEICDGLDNDCDGKGDLEELGFARAATEIAQTARTTYLFPSVAYAPEANQYGIVWDDQSDGYLRLWFARTDLNGALLSQPEVISPPVTGSTSQLLLPQIEWGGTEFGITWLDTPNSKLELFFQRRGSDGAQIGPVLNLTPGEDAAYSAVKRAGDGRWLVVYSGTAGGAEKELYRVVVAADGQSASAPELVKALARGEQVPRLASASGVYGAVWTQGSEFGNTVWWASIDAQLHVASDLAISPDPVPMNEAGGPAAIASDGQSFLVAYGYGDVSAGDLMVLNRDFSGNVKCGPVSVGTTTHTFPAMSPMAYGNGRFVVAYNDYDFSTSVGQQKLVVLRDDCTAIEPPVEIQGSGANGFLPGLAGGDKGFAFVWIDGASFPPKLMLRTFGPNLCD